MTDRRKSLAVAWWGLLPMTADLSGGELASRGRRSVLNV